MEKANRIRYCTHCTLAKVWTSNINLEIALTCPHRKGSYVIPQYQRTFAPSGSFSELANPCQHFVDQQIS